MSLINDALKKAQRDRETAGKEESAPAPAHTPVTHAGPRPGNPAASRSFRWMRTIIAGTLVLSGIAAALLFMRTLITPEPAPEVEPPREVAVHIKLGHPDASTLPGSSPDGAPADTVSPTAVPTAPTAETSVTSGSTSTPAAAPAPAEEPAIAFKLTDDTTPEASAPTSPATQTDPVANAQPSTAPVSPTTPANSPGPSSPAAPAGDSPAVATTGTTPSPATPPSSPASTPAPTTAIPAQEEPTSAPETGSAAAQAEPEGPTAIAFALPKQPVTVAGAENAADTTAPAQAGADPAIIAFLEASRIAGVKVAGKQSRVLMNNQVFFIGSVVDPQSRLRIKAITNSEIEFVDESGLEYRKRFQR